MACTLAAASPLDLYVLLEALRRAGEEDDEESAGGRCSFGRVCAHLRTLPAPPYLELDPEFDPEENAGDSDWEAAEDEQELRATWATAAALVAAVHGHTRGTSSCTRLPAG